MPQIITLLLTLLIFTNKSISQNNSFQDSLLNFEEHIFYAKSKKEATNNLLEKVDFLIKHDSIGLETFHEIKRIEFTFLSDSLKPRATWNATLISYYHQEFDYAWIYWNRYNKLTKDTSAENLFVGYLLAIKKDSSVASTLLNKLVIKDSLFYGLKDNYTLIKDPCCRVFKLVSSAIVPGSGLIMNGNIGKGLLSLGINSSIVLLMRFLIINSAWINVALMGTNLIGKFYLGGIRLTDKEIKKRNERIKNKRASKSALEIEEITLKYPIKFHLLN
jgi:hypothetical protein